MKNWICVTCGTQFAASEDPPAECLICLDQRQYVGHDGQQWTTLEEMRDGDYRNELRQEEPSLTGIGTVPSFAIGQRALLIQSPSGNILWDCITYLDPETVAAVQELGGVRAIAISHPHFYSAMNEWADAFDCEILLPEADREQVMRPSDRITFWAGGERDLWDGIKLVRLGGHFPGSSVLYWPAGAGGKGAVLAGDTVQVVADRRWVSFMYSYPNLIPLPKSEVRRIADRLAEYEFDRVYSGWFDRVVSGGGKEAVQRSADRYIRALDGELGHLKHTD